MLPLLKFYFHEEVRQAAVQSLPDLLRSAFLAAQKGLPGADADYVRRMVDFIWTPLMEAMAKVCAYQGLACQMAWEFISHGAPAKPCGHHWIPVTGCRSLFKALVFAHAGNCAAWMY